MPLVCNGQTGTNIQVLKVYTYNSLCRNQAGLVSIPPQALFIGANVQPRAFSKWMYILLTLRIWKLDKMGKWNRHVFLHKMESLATFIEFMSSNSVGRKNIQSANSKHDLIYNQILDFTKQFKKEKCSENWLILVCLGTFAGFSYLQSMQKGKWYQPENSTELVIPSRIQCRNEQMPKPGQLAAEVKFWGL